jgi:hypothetical protein
MRGTGGAWIDREGLFGVKGVNSRRECRAIMDAAKWQALVVYSRTHACSTSQCGEGSRRGL